MNNTSDISTTSSSDFVSNGSLMRVEKGLNSSSAIYQKKHRPSPQSVMDIEDFQSQLCKTKKAPKDLIRVQSSMQQGRQRPKDTTHETMDDSNSTSDGNGLENNFDSATHDKKSSAEQEDNFRDRKLAPGTISNKIENSYTFCDGVEVDHLIATAISHPSSNCVRGKPIASRENSLSKRDISVNENTTNDSNRSPAAVEIDQKMNGTLVNKESSIEKVITLREIEISSGNVNDRIDNFKTVSIEVEGHQVNTVFDSISSDKANIPVKEDHHTEDDRKTVNDEVIATTTLSQAETMERQNDSSQRQTPRIKKSCTFSDIIIHEHKIVLGNHPCAYGPSISLGWERVDCLSVPIDKYEASKPIRRTQKQMMLPRYVRERILIDHGVSRSEMNEAIEEGLSVRKTRQQTVNQYYRMQKIKSIFRYFTLSYWSKKAKDR